MTNGNHRKTAPKFIVQRDWLVKEFASFDDARAFLEETARENADRKADGENTWMAQRVIREKRTCRIILSARYPRVMLVHNWRC